MVLQHNNNNTVTPMVLNHNNNTVTPMVLNHNNTVTHMVVNHVMVCFVLFSPPL
jgi:hypothetical protein